MNFHKSKKTASWINCFLVGCLVVGAWALLCPPVGAALLNLTPVFPDITTGFEDISYNASTNIFSATAGDLTSTVDLDGVTPTPDYDIFGDNLNGGSAAFSLSVKLTTAGAIDNTGTNTLTIYGDAYDDNTYTPISGLSNPNLVFLTGTVTSFGFQNTGSPKLEFDFIVSSLSGDGASLFGPQVGIIMSAGSWATAFTGSFTSNFSNNTNAGSSDLFHVVPEPATGMLALLGFVLAGFYYRRNVSRLRTHMDPSGPAENRC